MNFAIDVVLTLAVIAALAIAVFFIVRFQQAAELGRKIQPLTLDDRLRVSLALASMATAEKELAKVAWIGNLPGNPQVTDLMYELSVVRSRAHRLLQES